MSRTEKVLVILTNYVKERGLLISLNSFLINVLSKSYVQLVLVTFVEVFMIPGNFSEQ